MGGLLQAGLLMELGFPSGKRQQALHVGGRGLAVVRLSFLLMSHVEMSTEQPVVWGWREKWGF